MAKPNTFSRETLYREVWRTPGIHLSKRYGVSDVALAKACRKMDIPRPGRGFWRQLEKGKSPEHLPLPRATATTILSHEFKPRDKVAASARTLAPKRKESSFRNPMAVSQRLTEPHVLIEASRAELIRGASLRFWDSIQFSRRHVSAITHPRSQDRAFRILDALLKAIESRGHGVTISTRYWGGACAVIFGQEIRFDMRDRDCSGSDDETPGGAPFRWSWEEGPARVRRGLVFRIHKSWNNGGGTSFWRDGKRQRLENLLDHILLQMLRLARKDRRYQIRTEKRSREEDERARIRRIREAEIEDEKKRRRTLLDAATDWRTSTLLRDFAEALEGRIGSQTEEARRALEWANGVADEMDPLRGPEDVVLFRISNPRSQEQGQPSQAYPDVERSFDDPVET